MEENLKIYNQLREVPPEAQKKITGGRLNGMTDIKPMWRIEKLTETFGMCGVGWKAPIKNKEIIEGANGEKIAIVDIDLYIKVNGEWSEAIEGTGGSSFIAREQKGLYTSDECFKMAYTDALSVACKSLGMGANVYWGDSKYNKPAEITTKKEAEKYVLTFGKYQNKTLKEVCEDDPYYAENYLYTKGDEIIRQCIALIMDIKEVSEKEQEEILNLTVRLNELIREKNVEYEKLLKHYKVKSNTEMSLEQLRDAVSKLESK